MKRRFYTFPELALKDVHKRSNPAGSNMKAKEKGPCRVQGCPKKSKYTNLCGAHYDRANRLGHKAAWVLSQSPKELLDTLKPLGSRKMRGPNKKATKAHKLSPNTSGWSVQPGKLLLDDLSSPSKEVTVAVQQVADAVQRSAEQVIEGFREPPKESAAEYYLKMTQNANNALREELRVNQLALDVQKGVITKLTEDLNANDDDRRLLEQRVEGMKLEATRKKAEYDTAMKGVLILQSRIEQLEESIPALKERFKEQQQADSDKIKELRDRLDEAEAKLEEHALEIATRPSSGLRVIRVTLNTKGEPRLLISGENVAKTAHLIGKSVYITE